MSKTKADQVQSIILNTTGFFSAGQISKSSGISQPYVMQQLHRLEASGKIKLKPHSKPAKYKVMVNQPNKPIEADLDVATRFAYIENLVDMVISGVQPSVLITGQPGIGKTYVVKDRLKKAGLSEEDYFKVSGHVSPLGLYQLLHDRRNEMLVFDDADSVFDSDISVNLLKAALDSYGERTVHWHSDKAEQKELDPCFEFKGRIVFISNRFADKLDPAVRSRAFCFNLVMTNDEICDHMINILPSIEPNQSMSLKKEVLEYLRTISSDFEQFSIRSLIQAIRIRVGADQKNCWKKMIRTLCCE